MVDCKRRSENATEAHQNGLRLLQVFGKSIVQKSYFTILGDEEEGSLLKTAAGYLAKDVNLPKTTIHTTLIKDFNIGHRYTRGITVVKFHKTRPVLIVADQGGNVQLFKVSCVFCFN